MDQEFKSYIDNELSWILVENRKMQSLIKALQGEDFYFNKETIQKSLKKLSKNIDNHNQLTDAYSQKKLEFK